MSGAGNAELRTVPDKSDRLPEMFDARLLELLETGYGLGQFGGTDVDGKSLEEIIAASAGSSEHIEAFSNAAQIWNHSFYWNCIAPDGVGQPEGTLAAKIAEDFKSFDDFKTAFHTAAANQFGSEPSNI